MPDYRCTAVIHQTVVVCGIQNINNSVIKCGTP